MLKKIVLFLICVLPLSLMAQETKLGHVNIQEVFLLMPELPGIQKAIEEENKMVENEISKMTDEFKSKLKEYQDKQNTLSDLIKQAREEELNNIQQRIQTFRQSSTMGIEKKKQELAGPINDRINKAITEVATEGKYLYIFNYDPSIFAYKSQNSNDVTPLVKKKLGLEKKAESKAETKEKKAELKEKKAEEKK